MFGLKMKFLGGEPRAYRQETGGARGAYTCNRTSGLAAGLAAGTLIATATGWRPVEAVARGDLILTFDRGLQPVRGITRGMHWDGGFDCPEALWPLTVPAGALGNRDPMLLLPEQYVMVESDAADILYGDPFTLLSAADLAGFRGIERTPPRPRMEVVQLHFDEDEVVFADHGALVLCPSLQVINVDQLMAAHPAKGLYAPLPSAEAKMLIDDLANEDAALAPLAERNFHQACA